MKLSLSSLFLMFGVLSSSSATYDDECRAMVTPYPTFVPQYGRWHFIMGYIDSKPFQTLFRSAMSQWIEFHQEANPLQLTEAIGIRHPTYCKFAKSPVTLHQNTAVTDKSNFTCTYHSLPTCYDCLLYMVNSRNNDHMLHAKGNTAPQTIQEVKQYRAIYLMARGTTLPPAELQYFRRQASCLGFSGPPNFYYNPQHPFCSLDEIDD